MLTIRSMWPIARSCSNLLLAKHKQVNDPNICAKMGAYMLQRAYSPPKKAIEQIVILKNQQIKCPTMRVVYTDNVTGQSTHKVMSRAEALDLAKDYNLDLILVSSASDPPICRLDDHLKLMLNKNTKAKEIRINNKARSLKEMFVGGGIDQHDLGIKMKKVIEFLSDGHPVKVSVTAKRHRLRIDPFCVEETTLKVLECVEDYVQSIQQPESSTLSRKDFTLNPKSKNSNPTAAAAKPKAEKVQEKKVPKPETENVIMSEQA